MRFRDLIKNRFQVETLAEASEELVDQFVGPWRGGRKEDLPGLAERLQVRLVYTDHAPYEGKYSWGPEGDLITLAKKCNPRRERFTLAHELAHCLLSRFANQESTLGERFRGVPATNALRQEEEVVANALAAELLMPRRVIISRLQHEGVSWELIRSLRERFEVSRTAVIRRLAEIGRHQFVYLSLIPRQLKDLNSRVVVDECLIATPDSGARVIRDGIFIRQRLSFSKITSVPCLPLGVVTGDVFLWGNFAVNRSAQLIPSAKLLGAVQSKSLSEMERHPASSKES